MILSIGMIVKNEEKYLEKCLNGLKPILDNVDSELIIADTGSTDRTVEIAKQFTDNVFHFEWIDDFAAARNSTLEKARGEWYMFVDGDEIFDSCDDLIRFFNSGEYRKYNAASYIIRNLLSNPGEVNGTHYTDFNAPRLARIQPHTQFVGKIHEHLNTYIAPFRKLNDIVLHYGYLYENDAEMKEKMTRNIELLEKRLKEAGDNVSGQLYMQLYESYSNYDKTKAYEYLERGIEVAKEQNDLVLVALYCDKAQDLFFRGDYDGAIQVCDEYFAVDKSIRNKPLTSDAEMYAFRASSNYNLENYDAAIEDYIKFFDTFKLIKSGKLTTYDSYLLAYAIASDRNFIPLLNEFVYCCTHTGKYNLAAGYLQSLPISRYSEIEGHIPVIVKQIISVMGHLDFQNPKQYYKQLDDYGKRLLKEYLCLEAYLTDDPAPVLAALSELGRDDEELNEKVPVMTAYFNGETVPEDTLAAFSEKYSISRNPEILMIALKQGCDITRLFGSPDFDMKLAVYTGYMKLYGFALAVQNYSDECIRDDEKIPQAIRFFEYCMKTVPIYRSPKPRVFAIFTVESIFGVYAKLGRRYADYIKTEELPPEISAACIAGEIIQSRQEKRYKDCFAAMKQAIVTYNGIAAVIEEYQKIVLKEYESSMKSMSEMDRLAMQVKNNIRKFIASGNMTAAKQTLEQYKSINPNDAEIRELNRLIENA